MVFFSFAKLFNVKAPVTITNFVKLCDDNRSVKPCFFQIHTMIARLNKTQVVSAIWTVQISETYLFNLNLFT